MTVRVDENVLKELVHALNTLAPHLEPLRHEVKALRQEAKEQDQHIGDLRLELVKAKAEQKAAKEQAELAAQVAKEQIESVSKTAQDKIHQLQGQVDLLVTTIRGNGNVDGIPTRIRGLEADVKAVKEQQELSKKDKQEERKERFRVWVALITAGLSLVGVIVTAIFGFVSKFVGGG
jgi:chromosome segregation ATPase